MTAGGGIILQPPESLAVSLRRVELRWLCNAIACASRLERDASRLSPHDLAMFNISLDVRAAGVAALLARIEFQGASAILFRGTAVCRQTADGDLLHLDAWRADERLLSLTIRNHRELLYARSSMLSDAGLTKGRCDKPILMCLLVDRALAVPLSYAET